MTVFCLLLIELVISLQIALPTTKPSAFLSDLIFFSVIPNPITTFLDLSKKGLDKRNELNKRGKNETIYLKHIEEIIENKKTRAEMLIEQYNKTKKLDFLINHDENFSYSGF